jgi:adenosylcobinamide-GDP ribazoletransferase
MLKEIRNLLAFLTVIPFGMDQGYLADTANYMPLFPLCGALIGLLAGVVAWLLSFVFPDLIFGMLTLGFLLMATGLHHTDGLLDFADGLLFQGSPEKKIEIMHDQRTGAGGLVLGLMTLLTTAFCIGGLRRSITLQSLIVSEVLAKLAMVVGAWVGRSAHEGMNTYFVNAMHSHRRELRLAIALAISFVVALTLLGVTGLIAITAALIASLALVEISNRHFGGITGDVMGAMNDIVRMFSLLSILGAMRWW